MPVSTELICLNAQHLANKLKSPQSVRNFVNGICVLQVLVDQMVNAFQSPDLRLTFRGLARIKQHQARRAQAIMPEMLSRISERVDPNTLDLVVWAAIFLAFFCLLRKCNYVPDSQKTFDRSKQLCREDAAVGQDCIVVHRKWYKAIQLAERTLHIPVLAIPNSPICPVKASQGLSADGQWGTIWPRRPLVWCFLSAGFPDGKPIKVITDLIGKALPTHK